MKRLKHDLKCFKNVLIFYINHHDLEELSRVVEEMERMRKHPQYGVEILEALQDAMGCDAPLKPVINEMCLYHHEKHDGTGYPVGKRLHLIPLAAQICTIADSLDAIVSERPYKSKTSFEYGYQTILQGEGSYFSPYMILCFQHAKADLLYTHESLISRDVAGVGKRDVSKLPERVGMMGSRPGR